MRSTEKVPLLDGNSHDPLNDLTGNSLPLQLRSRNSGRLFGAEPASNSNVAVDEKTYAWYSLSPDDTLQKVALKFSLTVNELKRINGLVSDQDFFALKALRIPDNRLQHLTTELRLKTDIAPSCEAKPSGKDSPVVDPFSVDDGIAPSNHLVDFKQSEPPAASGQRVIANLFCEVDKNLEKAKILHDQMQWQNDAPDEGGAQLHLYNDIDKQRRIGWFRQNICHFTVVLLLVIAFVVLPILWFCTKLLS
uniref:LysM domain-containing protein n=1 Tax=Trichuris muris TaxID=70415 RepID=A0A5S6QBU2_TRIMR